ncbi:MAG: hypothetical protein ACPG5B_08695 [Chitinophagales bacterium]
MPKRIISNEVKCTSCKEWVDGNEMFCSHCGEKLEFYRHEEKKQKQQENQDSPLSFIEIEKSDSFVVMLFKRFLHLFQLIYMSLFYVVVAVIILFAVSLTLTVVAFVFRMVFDLFYMMFFQ